MENITVIKVGCKNHVITSTYRENYYNKVAGGGVMPNSDYLGTRKALCGILKEYESLDMWLRKKKKRMKLAGL